MEVGRAENNLLSICYATDTKIKHYVLWIKVSANCTHTKDSYLCLVPSAQTSWCLLRSSIWKDLPYSWKKPQNGYLNGMPSTPVTIWMKIHMIHSYRNAFRGGNLTGRQGGLTIWHSCICIASPLTYIVWFIWGGFLEGSGRGSWCWLWEGFALSFLYSKYFYSPPNHLLLPLSPCPFHLWAVPSNRNIGSLKRHTSNSSLCGKAQINCHSFNGSFSSCFGLLL